MSAAIYAIKNNVNGKMYVGQTIDRKRRFREHKHDLNKGTHYNTHLQRAWNKYGSENFEFIILEECEEHQLDVEEEKHAVNSPNGTYNKSKGFTSMAGSKNPFFGRTHKSSSKKLMSDWKKKNYQGKGNPNYGKKNSIDAKIKMSEGRSKRLVEKDVLEIASLLEKGISHKTISEKFDVGRTTVTRISNGTRWSNVTGGPIVPVIYKNGKRIFSANHLANRRGKK